ncbi:MAG: hypothetical protein IPK72_17695 [Candidatus Eisenbacteria bacterium]|nr:hypothetical protein [Candidatus Eisenbacteria bacterium]
MKQQRTEAGVAANIQHPVILVRLNRLFREGMSSVALYEATRGVWKLGKRREGARYALAVYRGLVREVYEIRSWFPAGTLRYETRAPRDVNLAERVEFEGRLAPESVRAKYVGCSVRADLPAGSRAPVLYVGC